MGASREKDTGKFSPQVAGVGIEKLDLTRDTRPVTTNFQRTNLGPDNGRARPNMPAESQGPTVPSSSSAEF
jgi:hypothetical protein